MKHGSKITEGFFMALKIWGSSWLAFLVAFVPLYIWRGLSQSHGEETRALGQNILMGVIGLCFGFLFLMLLQAKSDEAGRLGDKETLVCASWAVVIYVLAWLFLYFVREKNNVMIAAGGFYFSCLLGVGADERPTWLASLLTALIFGAVYFVAILLGARLARRRKARFLKK